jgi:glycosyltransferase involved in cell wall biosynthesis
MTPNAHTRICFVGLENLPVLSRQYNHHGIGGEQVQQTLLARAFVRRGMAVSMVVADYGQADGEVIDGITLIKAHGLTDGIPILRFIHPRLTKLWWALERARADVYYVSCASAQLGIVALFARLHHRRVVFRVASDSDCDPSALLIRLWRDKKIYEYGLHRADVVLVQSAHQMQALQANYGCASRLARMLVDPAASSRPFAQRDIDVLWVNNLRPLKRPEMVLALARQLPHLRFHIVGGPQFGYEALYEHVALKACRIPNLTFHGQVPYHEISNYYARARILINTSEIEGFPNAYLQAWRRGTPAVATFDPDGVINTHGLGASARTLNDMVEHINQLACSTALWDEASARCLAFMDGRYSESQVMGPYVEALCASRLPRPNLTTTSRETPSQ